MVLYHDKERGAITKTKKYGSKYGEITARREYIFGNIF